ncbi:MAG: glycoside hydrolase family 2 TIM barrel-domain containing protein [Bacteroidales bacterium]|jgi:beta-mannosidase|nr:glycoside hydrolase family 2 TIM barrel-domain containing protein [Bacteroidales bacterium]MDD3151861.1 glycoside hydrolase family 2 TIM barrel-domain containing protein [Bacteroidales bacterium]MDD3914391.1 glycoside hydrolase family 2 TIM barrel-domain containing protein [Bacteroidales bacterium]MDD4633485.1 glycoside hydrolase family 2 TIM barrel-domain containing protein [Bacteroidales bacterium]
MRKICAALLVICTLLSCTKKNAVEIVNLDKWEFSFDSTWYAANIPSCIHTDLLAHNLIEDPFYRSNEDSIQWISNSQWTYKTSFDKTTNNNIINLVFDGIDTYAKIYLNGQMLKNCDDTTAVFTTNNMFRKWSFDVSKQLKDIDNALIVVFYPSSDVDKQKASQLAYSLPDIRAFSRKAPYQSGWDWGPMLPTMGLWQPVYLESWSLFHITDIQTYQKALCDSVAEIEVVMQIQATDDITASFDYIVDSNTTVNTNKNLIRGLNTITQSFIITNPELWYPNGLGQQKLYTVEAVVKADNYIDKAKRRIGLRTIELVTDQDKAGSKFEFHVNGQPVFMKGCNYIPSESFTTRCTEENYRHLLQSCKDANMNMLRIWGGGIYENDIFYDICDELGLLVWQDFIFACALYPGDEAFLNNVSKEAEYQIKRLRNHPSIALWCGNNEVKNGWEDWGWQNDYSEEQRQEIENNYKQIFGKILPDAVSKYDNGRFYHESSPLWGWGHKECCTSGDSHYWGVWWGEQPFEVWSEKTGRFMSEYGFQSYPETSTIETFTLPEDRNIHSAVMKNHQKHGRGIEIINNYMNMYYGVPENFYDYLYTSQLVQSFGIGNALEIHRLKMPYCMGTLYWQLNDCWQVASWSSIDYYGNWKALHYTAKRKFGKMIVATEMHSDTAYIYLVSDLYEDIEGKLKIEAFDFNGKLQRQDIVNEIVAKQNTSSLVCIYPIRKDFMENAANIFINITFMADGAQGASKILYLTFPKNLDLPDGKPAIEVKKYGNEYNIKLSTNVLLKDVYISTKPNTAGIYSDNYFDMLPNSNKEIKFTPKEEVSEAFEFIIKTYNNAF